MRLLRSQLKKLVYGFKITSATIEAEQIRIFAECKSPAEQIDEFD